MSIHVALNHVTHYRYDRLVHLGPQVVRLRPAPHSRTRILSYSMRVVPEKHFLNWQQDPQSNYLARLVFPEPTREFRVEVDLVAEMAVLNPFDFFIEEYAQQYPFGYKPEEKHELAPFLEATADGEHFADYVMSIDTAPRRTIDFLVDLNQRVQKDIRYLIRMEPGVQTPEETLVNGCGSCRDSGWLLVQLLRHMGFAARFVSGYLIQLKADVKSLDGPSGTEQDFTDLHAWCEVYLPGAGWIGLDPTSGLLAGEGHIPLACSPEPGSAAPITGALDECEVEFSHSMSVARVWEAPRVTLPYSEEQWARIESLGASIDEKLKAGDVRLTQGGEPTFVSVDDRDGAEWNTEAMGPNKRRLSEELLLKLKARYAPQGLLHYGQGKWYPGEQLPRWSLNAFWRRDGEPLWSDPELFARSWVSNGANTRRAEDFLVEVADRLGVSARHMFPAFEDVLYYLWRERRLPGNVDPFESKLEDPLERQRLRKVFAQGLDSVVGYALPVARPFAGAPWQSGPWFLRDERCYLVPGDSPLGYRLPLDSQPWTSSTDYPWIHMPDQTQQFPPLPPYRVLQQSLGRPVGARDAAAAAELAGAGGTGARAAVLERLKKLLPLTTKKPVAQQSAAWITRTALCAEPRDGRLHLFMPPVSSLEDYLELVAAIEATAVSQKMPVVLEGSEPPRDPRLKLLRVTPDPGVIEVNIHPAADWAELSAQTQFLYQAAHETRLSTEKFALDGKHQGTGGGNHFVLGGATTNDSPFLRRPDVLASMIAYWHNHPSLSYLFSGQFIGPTSQAPRVDEARNDAVYELEIAMKELRRLQGLGWLEGSPWQVDRALRNILVDVTGNTHRAEFCIDKLYTPEGGAGRLGLLELRAFEMPPHARMSLVQQLLLRGLIARFWQQPYQPRQLARWGTELHDRFLLPHFVQDDFRDVLAELGESGLPMQEEWFAPHLEFRFPKLGDFTVRNIDVELRGALEPWHVLGEQGAPGGTARYVDSSLERLQVKVRGMTGTRHVLTANGVTLPLHPTGTVGEYVAGVRYRAWWLPTNLHPSIGVHAPLTFDLVDTWMDRSMGGARYHVAHPGGRNYVTFPVNAYEAEARRLARFFRMGHTPGGVKPVPPQQNPDHPLTLDLRQVGTV
ncbi:MAG TPA: transglutaminase family protein [Steroidobacteraceae bacterium]|nr:transglutaminase family protein [Steroidobacteraceae bacterium]